jgi:hypothetical protein
MSKLIHISLIGFLLLLVSCKEKEVKPSFDTFEISYTGGWINKGSFLVGFNKKYYCQERQMEYAKTGKLPDSIFFEINNLSQEIFRIQKFDSIKEDCFDCAILSIKVKIGKQKIIIYQKGNVDNKFGKLTRDLATFLESGKHQQTNFGIHFETADAIAPPMVDFVKVKEVK